MKHPQAVRLAVVSFLAALSLLGQYPKRYTEKITIAGAGRSVEITGEAAHSRFRLGGGPGFTNNGVRQFSGWIVEDWLTKAPEPAAELTRYLVTYHITVFKDSSDERQERYHAYYVYDPVAKRGYVRLPAKGEAHYDENVQIVFHGDAFQGPWFATDAGWAGAVEEALAPSVVRPRP